MVYTVGEAAKRLGLSPSTLRYYDKEGLLPFVERSSGGIRMFQEKDFEWLQVIECMKKAGMPIKDIRQYLELSADTKYPAGLVGTYGGFLLCVKIFHAAGGAFCHAGSRKRTYHCKRRQVLRSGGGG